MKPRERLGWETARRAFAPRRDSRRDLVAVGTASGALSGPADPAHAPSEGGLAPLQLHPADAGLLVPLLGLVVALLGLLVA